MANHRRTTADSDPFQSSISLESGSGLEASPSVHRIIATGDRTEYGGMGAAADSNIAQNSHGGTSIAQEHLPRRPFARVTNAQLESEKVEDLASREEKLRERFDRALESSNTLLAFIAAISLLIAITTLLLLFYTQTRFSARSPPSTKVTDEVSSGCLLVSLVLALIAAAVSGITHSGVLSTLASQRKQKRVSVRSGRSHISNSNVQERYDVLHRALSELQSHDDALFWFVCFLCPALVALVMGLMIFVWTEHSLGVAVAVSVALVYGVVQAGRVVAGLARAAAA